MLTTYLLILTLQNDMGYPLSAIATHEMKTLQRCEAAGTKWVAQKKDYRYYTCSKL